MQEIAAKRYAHALFGAGVDKNNLDLFLEHIESVSSVYKDNKDLSTFLNHPTISIEEKTSLIENVFKGRVDEEILNLIVLLLEHGRINEISLVSENFRRLVDDHKGIKTAYATTAVKMTTEEIENLESKLSAKYNLKIKVENFIDESVIGGVYLKIDDEVFDGTIKGSLEKIQKEVMKQGGEVRA
ncbi:F0F1 ATP synthase subunit delta [Clostridium cylindrosporum]|uniref:ATP synthase subunit delta n=1 Tax=Clostridium cylindrosporum DSM 605 TaxID=1121307 RepID=A0A0J8G537_CLOCY|nr:F0F1 ATP synthase subunit delta [Clostridium cylindrosporum]KMT22781.1 ATP synthase subunit delta [Clostridium cylindrosporum DSM 605]